MYYIGYDIGSSSVKFTLVDEKTKKSIAVVSQPKNEMVIKAGKFNWAEQDPNIWWDCICTATKRILYENKISSKDILAIGISYQMHGLVILDNNDEILHPSIIWCDSRYVKIGERALNDLGKDHCLNNYLNSPGNFTISKLKWIQENKPDIYSKIKCCLLYTSPSPRD